MYVDILISNVCNMNKLFFFFFFRGIRERELFVLLLILQQNVLNKSCKEFIFYSFVIIVRFFVGLKWPTFFCRPKPTAYSI